MEPPVVIVTGANAGIGRALVASLLERGCRVAALDIDTCALRSSENLLVCRCDVTSEAEVERAVDDVVREWGRIDVLVNNACLAVFGRFEECGTEQARREFEVNYFGYRHAIAAVLPHMKAQRSGIIHNVGSGVGLTGFPGLSGYASTKGAIEALSRTLALELAADGIAVTVMHPPLTNTKSAAPLGLPAQAMADPAEVGRRLARKILSRKPLVTPDLRTAIYVRVARCVPVLLGRVFSKLAAGGQVRAAGK